MIQNKIIDINDIKPEQYASFGIALMVMRMHGWMCESINNGKLEMSRSVADEFAADYDDNFEEDFEQAFDSAVGSFKKNN
tara:strand:+ start:889 stop:1128 length:240 start_codon:yes stop_codon:yes gene_type:complete